MANQSDEKWINIGSCKKPHGIKGGYGPFLVAKDQCQLKKGSEVLLRPIGKESSLPKKGKVYEVQSISHGNKSILYLKGVDNRNLAEKLLPFDIFLSRGDFSAPEEGEFYLSDLEGLPVFNFESKERVGEVKGHMDNGAQIILEVKTSNNQSLLIPFIDQFVPVAETDEDDRPTHLEIILPEEV